MQNVPSERRFEHFFDHLHGVSNTWGVALMGSNNEQSERPENPAGRSPVLLVCSVQ